MDFALDLNVPFTEATVVPFSRSWTSSGYTIKGRQVDYVLDAKRVRLNDKAGKPASSFRHMPSVNSHCAISNLAVRLS